MTELNTDNPNPRRQPGKTSSHTPPEFAHDLERLSMALAVLARELPARTTIRQTLAFVLVALHDAMGRSVTLKDLQHIAGSTADGRPVIGQTIERTLDTFREPTNRAPDALNWVTDEVDPDDRRLKYFHLTPEGTEQVREIIAALAAADEEDT